MRGDLGLSPLCTSTISRLEEEGWLYIKDASSSLMKVVCMCLLHKQLRHYSKDMVNIIIRKRGFMSS